MRAVVAEPKSPPGGEREHLQILLPEVSLELSWLGMKAGFIAEAAINE
jgi:hypothetical protein